MATESRTSRTLVLCLLMIGATTAVALLVRDAAVVTALALSWGAVLGSWVGGKGVASYHDVLRSRNGGGS